MIDTSHTCTGDTTACVSRVAGTDEAVLCSHNISAGSEHFMTVVPAQSTLIKVFKINNNECMCDSMLDNIILLILRVLMLLHL